MRSLPRESRALSATRCIVSHSHLQSGGRLTIRASIFESIPMQTPVTKNMAGMMVMTMRASFHWTASATMYAEKKSDMP